MFIQGDVFIVETKIPKDAKKVKTNILAMGEVTGHSHTVEDAEVYEKDGILYIKNPKVTTVKHQEHKEITIPRGEWRVGIVKEYDPFLEESRQVRD